MWLGASIEKPWLVSGHISLRQAPSGLSKTSEMFPRVCFLLLCTIYGKVLDFVTELCSTRSETDCENGAPSLKPSWPCHTLLAAEGTEDGFKLISMNCLSRLLYHLHFGFLLGIFLKSYRLLVRASGYISNSYFPQNCTW